MKKIFFELCGETLEAAQAAEEGGADRVELCSALHIGGVTPEFALVSATIRSVRLPIHVLVRPRAGDFVYTREEFRLMLEQIRRAKEAGAHGVVTGVLTAEGTVDVDRTLELSVAARPMRVTFHRAFDECAHLSRALEEVIRTGADYLLSSGGAVDVHTGASMLGKLNRQAKGRVQLIGGGGLRLDSLAALVREADVQWVHGSLTRSSAQSVAARERGTLQRSIDQAVRILQNFQVKGASTGDSGEAGSMRG